MPYSLKQIASFIQLSKCICHDECCHGYHGLLRYTLEWASVYSKKLIVSNKKNALETNTQNHKNWVTKSKHLWCCCEGEVIILV